MLSLSTHKMHDVKVFVDSLLATQQRQVKMLSLLCPISKESPPMTHFSDYENGHVACSSGTCMHACMRKRQQRPF